MKKSVIKETLESKQFLEFFNNVPKEHKMGVLEVVLGICHSHQKIVDSIESMSPEEKAKAIMEILNVRDR